MAEHEPEISILDQRLAEIDRRLSRIQVGLAEEAEASAPPATSPPSVADPAPARTMALAPPLSALEEEADDVDDPALVAAELRGLISDQARLLDRLAELVAAGERLFSPAGPPPPAARPAPHTPTVATAAGALTVAAGPFPSLDAVRAFQGTLAALPGVDSAEVRGYESGDRVVVDVHLSPATS